MICRFLSFASGNLPYRLLPGLVWGGLGVTRAAILVATILRIPVVLPRFWLKPHFGNGTLSSFLDCSLILLVHVLQQLPEEECLFQVCECPQMFYSTFLLD